MKIFSKIVESDQILDNIDIDDIYKEEADVLVCKQNWDDDYAIVKSDCIHSDGLHIISSSINSKKNLSHYWQTCGHHIRYFFYLKGISQVENGAGNHSYEHQVGILQRNYLEDGGGGGTVHIEENKEIKHVIIKMSPDYYLQLLHNESWIQEDTFHHYILKGSPANRPSEFLAMDLKIVEILEELLAVDTINYNKQHYLKIKLRELLFHINHVNQFGNVTNKNNRKDDHIAEIMQQIQAYISLNLDNPPNLSALTKKFSINEKKLKENFKSYYGKTIYAFIIQERMEKAKKMLYQDYNVNELAIHLGYQSVSHFIKVFKSYHGYTPKELSNSIKAISNTVLKTVQILISSFLLDII